MNNFKRNNKTSLLIWVLFVFISLLVGAIGLRLKLDEEAYKILGVVGLVSMGVVFLAFILGVISSIVKIKKKIIPSKVRDKLTDEFNFAEDNFDKFISRLRNKNLIYGIYFFIIGLIGFVGYLCVSFILFVKLQYVVPYIILMPICVCPLWRKIECFLLRGNDDPWFDWFETDFPQIYASFEETAEKVFNKKMKIKVGFGENLISSAKKIGDTLYLRLNTYAFYILTEKELIASLIREFFILKDKELIKIDKTLKNRDIYKNEVPYGFIFSGIFSFIIEDTMTSFDFAYSAISRRVEKKADEFISKTEYAEDYITAYKKLSVFNAFLGDPQSYIYLNLYKNGGDVRCFTNYVFDYFKELYEVRHSKWVKLVENKLKPLVTDKLTYKEKVKIIGKEALPFVIENNLTEDTKYLYERLFQLGNESVKLFYDMKKAEFEECNRIILRYEQNPEDYDERLKLISVAHAFVTMGEIDKAEQVYKTILKQDNLPESCFDYGAFLLTIKDDSSGIDYIYKSMENENIVDDGFELLGKYFILSGDSEGYERYCEYKKNKMDELVSGVNDRIINENSRLDKPTIEDHVLENIIEVLSKDDNITEIYCADAKVMSGKPITVFGIRVRNKSEQSLVESFERVFSILDNDYGEYDTFLVSMDNEKERKIVKNMLKDKDFLKYTKNF